MRGFHLAATMVSALPDSTPGRIAEKVREWAGLNGGGLTARNVQDLLAALDALDGSESDVVERLRSAP